MTAILNDTPTTDEFQRDNETLRERLHVAEKTLGAIYPGGVDS